MLSRRLEYTVRSQNTKGLNVSEILLWVGNGSGKKIPSHIHCNQKISLISGKFWILFPHCFLKVSFCPFRVMSVWQLLPLSCFPLSLSKNQSLLVGNDYLHESVLSIGFKTSHFILPCPILPHMVCTGISASPQPNSVLSVIIICIIICHPWKQEDLSKSFLYLQHPTVYLPHSRCPENPKCLQVHLLTFFLLVQNVFS